MVEYVCEEIFDKSKEGHQDGKGSSFPSLRDSPNQCFATETTGDNSDIIVMELPNRSAAMQLLHSTIL